MYTIVVPPGTAESDVNNCSHKDAFRVFISHSHKQLIICEVCKKERRLSTMMASAFCVPGTMLELIIHIPKADRNRTLKRDKILTP